MSAEEEIYDAIESAVTEGLSAKEIRSITTGAYVQAVKDKARRDIDDWSKEREKLYAADR